MAYSNITPPTLPEYDSALYSHYVLEFEYENGSENWIAVSLRYSSTPFTYDGGAVTNAVEHHLQTYGSGTGEWTYWGILTEMSIAPGTTSTGGYRRIWTNHNILEGSGKVWLAANTATPAEANLDRLSIMKSKLAGLIMAWCAPVRQFPQREPVEQEPGTPIAEYNLLDFGGSWRGDNIEDASGEASYTRIAFSVGEFPLHFTTKWVLSVNSEVVAPFNWVSLEPLPFKAGERVRIEVRFPESDFGELEYDFRRVGYSFNDADLWLSHYFQITYESNQSQLICKQLKMFVSYDLNEVHDPNGRLVGFVLDGVLESDLVKIDITDQAVSITNEKPTTFSLTTKFADYDSLKIAVYEQEE